MHLPGRGDRLVLGRVDNWSGRSRRAAPAVRARAHGRGGHRSRRASSPCRWRCGSATSAASAPSPSTSRTSGRAIPSFAILVIGTAAVRPARVPGHRLVHHVPRARRAGHPAARHQRLRRGRRGARRPARRRAGHGHVRAGGAPPGRAAGGRAAAHGRRPHRGRAGRGHRHHRRLRRAPAASAGSSSTAGPSDDQAEIFAGALLVALLSLATEGGLALVQSLVTPRGLRYAEVPTGAEAAARAAAPNPPPDGRGTL